MMLLEQSSLVVHIMAGFVALFMAPGAMLARKGSLWHRRWGRVFVWAMSVVAASALLLALTGGDTFLSLVAIFSFYLAFSDWRVLHRKRLVSGDRLPALDLVVTVGTLLASGSLALYGVWQLVAGSSFGAVAVAFGVLGCVLSGRDLRQMIQPPLEGRWWWYVHMINMLAAYIATVSAFSAVNFDFMPPLVQWLWPTAVGTPAIFVWVAYYKRRFASRGAADKTVKEAVGE